MNKYIMFKHDYLTPTMTYVANIKYRIHKEDGISYILRQTDNRTGEYIDFSVAKNLENEVYTIGLIKGD